MFRLKTTLAAGIATLGMLFAASESQAQSFGLSLNLGRGGISYFQGNEYAYSPYFYTPPVYRDVYVYPSYGSYVPSGIAIVGPTIVQPERYHWSPYRGWHTHGSVYAPTYSGRIVRVPY